MSVDAGHQRDSKGHRPAQTMISARDGACPGSVVLPTNQRPFNPSRQTALLLSSAGRIGPQTKALCQQMFDTEGRVGQRAMWRIVDVSQLANARGEKVEGWFVLGEVVAVYIDKFLIEDGVYNTALARRILRAGRGGDYLEVRTENMFEMKRPPVSSKQEFHGT